MRKLLGVLLALALLPTVASAVTYSLATVSMVVRQNNPSGNITTTVLNNRKFLNFVSASSGVPISDLFIGINETTGELLVIQRSNETIRFGILTSLTITSTAANGTGTNRYITVNCVVSSLTANVGGGFLEMQSRNRAGAVTLVKRTFFGGGSGQVIQGTVVTTGRKITL